MKLIPADKLQIPFSDFISDYYSTSLKADSSGAVSSDSQKRNEYFM